MDATTQRMPDLAVGGHAEIETTNTHSMRTMLGREAKERGWVITTRTIANGLRVHRIK